MLSHTVQTLILINYRESNRSNHGSLELEITQKHRYYVSIMPEKLEHIHQRGAHCFLFYY